MKDDMKLEMQAGRNIQLDHLNEFITNPQDCESIYIEALKRGNKDLVEENQRLKAQLDREIHINRKMKNALEVYANIGNWASDGYEFAQQTLKQIEEME
jgi:hypothetical protein